jgi:hypothetical protein
MKSRSLLIGSLFLCVAAGVGSVCFLFRTERAILSRLQEPKIGEILILAESEDRFEEWKLLLCWRRPKGDWMQYLLENEVPIWKTAGLVSHEPRIVVTRNGQEFGYLDTHNGEFFDEVHHYTNHHPIAINMSDDPFSRVNRVFPESTAWTSVWPRALQVSTENPR